MAPDQEPSARPRRERPLVAPSRQTPSGEPLSPPSVTTPPTGSRVFEPPVDMVVTEREDHVDVAFPGPAPQRRWTIAIRFILLIPHFLWLYILNLGLQLAVVIAWFGALFTKRVPDEVASFIGKVLRYQVRVMGYSFLLTDEYPPFGLNDEHGIDLVFNPGEHNRLAVFFRLILMVPSTIVAGLAVIGAGMFGVIGWLLALIMGRLPTPMWEATAAVFRYLGRTYAYGSLLTAEQPKGLYGDKESTAFAPPVDESSGLPDLPVRPRIVRLVLSKGAKALVTLFIALAVLVYGGLFVSGALLSSRLSDSYNELDEDHDTLIAGVGAWTGELQQCAFSGGQPCLANANTKLADRFAEFAAEVSLIEFPPNLGPQQVVEDALRCEAALRAMAAATDESSYNEAFRSYQQAVEDFDEEYAAFAGDLAYET